jgi:hypothetical protein
MAGTWKKLLLCLLTFVSNLRFNGGHLFGAELIGPNPIDRGSVGLGFGELDSNKKSKGKSPRDADSIDIPAATIYSSKAHGDIDLNLPKKLCQKAIDKYEKFKNQEPLILPNTTSGIFYTFLGGIVPWPELMLDEIDALKVFGYGELRRHFVQLTKNLANIKQIKVKPIKKAFKKYLRKIDKYIAFWEEKFDGVSQQNIKKLREQFQIVQNKLFKGIVRIHAQNLLALLNDIDHLQLNLPGNPPFNFLQELFHPEMLLLYAMAKDATINGLRFATFKRQNPLYVGLYHDMCLLCETQFAWLSNETDRADKQLIVCSVSPSKNLTRLPNAPFPRYIFLPNFIKIAFPEE